MEQSIPFGVPFANMGGPQPTQISPIEQNQNLMRGLYGMAYAVNQKKKKHAFPMPHPMLMGMLNSAFNRPSLQSGGLLNSYYNDFQG